MPNAESTVTEPTNESDAREPLDVIRKLLDATLDERDISHPALMPLLTDAGINELATYESLFILESIGDAPKATPLTAAINPFERSSAPSLPALGLLTTHEQKWVQQGLALGNLLHSVCLAPGEITQVAVVDWQRRVTGASTQTVDQSEDVSSAAEQTRAVNEVQQAMARETQEGGSTTSATAATAQAGGSFGGAFGAVSMSGSMSTTSGMTAQFSRGARDLAASSAQALSQRTAEKSQALRSRRAAVVREVSQTESETLNSRVLVNYNRKHALNIEYFEVLQRYAIKTHLARWDRCLFVPLMLIDFSDPKVLQQHKAELSRHFIGIGRPELIDELLFDTDTQSHSALEQEIKALEAAVADDVTGSERVNRLNILKSATALAETWSSSPSSGVVTSSHSSGRDAGLAAEASYNGLRVQAPWLPALTDTALSEIKQQLASLDMAVANKHIADLGAARARQATLRLTAQERLMADQLALSQAIWMQMDAFSIYGMLAGYTVNGQPLATLVEPYPVGVFGNYLAFRWGFERSDAGAEERALFERRYVSDSESTPTVTTTIGVPTSGVFAEAVLGRGQAAETIDDRRLWDWQAYPIPIVPAALADLTRDRSNEISLDAGDFATSLAELRSQAPFEGSQLGAMLETMGKADMFRNMGGLAEAVTLADKVAAISGSGATAAGKQAADIHAKILDTFVEVLNSDVGKAAVAEFMLPGAGAALLGAGNGAASEHSGANAGQKSAPAHEAEGG